jgi:2,3-bisphosphoglycerate-independent phosphoglycerate mutase
MAKNRLGLLIILDGFGINTDPKFNAIAMANAPTLDRLLRDYPHTTLEASESHVGLPPGFMGNSEVGHLNIGAGRVVYQDFSLISRAIANETFFENPAFVKLATDMKAHKPMGALHLMGLVSDGGVHSHLSHLMALVQMAKRQGIPKVYIHAFTDGRDTSPVSGIEFLAKLQDFCRDADLGKIATVTGRFFAMDRDNRWERTEQAYHTIVDGKAAKEFTDPVAYLKTNYEDRITDEFIPPGKLRGYDGMKPGDGVLFFNFRADRARELTRAMTQHDFNFFRREAVPALAGFVCMTPYDDSFGLPAAYEKAKVLNTLGEIVSKAGWKQLRIAETEKYAHVTYFFNGGEERVFEGEKRILIPSPREVRTYDLKPEMSALELTDALLTELKTGDYQFVVVNFANPDMVGHTGNLRAAIKAVETVDGCLQKIVSWVESHDAFAVITADHGNCEKMQDSSGMPLTSHTLLPVPFIVVDAGSKQVKLTAGGKLADIAPTMLQLWGLKAPSEMTGRSLIASSQ